MKPRISLITLGVSDLAQSIAFYQKLGFPKVDSPPEVAFFSLNGTWLGLFDRKSLAKDAGVSSKGNGFNHFTLAHNVASESEVSKLYNQALKAGAKGLREPQKASWGGYCAYFSDLDGHIWELAYNPYLWIGPKDN